MFITTNRECAGAAEDARDAKAGCFAPPVSFRRRRTSCRSDRCLRPLPMAAFVRPNFDSAKKYRGLLKVNHVANTIAVLFRRSVIEAIGGFDRSSVPADDVELLLHAAKLFPAAHHRSVVADYRRYRGSVSRRGEMMLPAVLGVMQRHRDAAKGDARLITAGREGEAYWRDFSPRRGQTSHVALEVQVACAECD